LKADDYFRIIHLFVFVFGRVRVKKLLAQKQFFSVFGFFNDENALFKKFSNHDLVSEKNYFWGGGVQTQKLIFKFFLTLSF